MINLIDIHRLKQQFRHGANPPPPSDDDLSAWDAFKGALTGVKDATLQLTSATSLQVTGAERLIIISQNLFRAYTDLAKQQLWLEKRNEALNKTFGLSVKQSAIYGQNLDNLSAGFKKGGDELRKYAINLKTVIGNYQLKDNSFSKNLLRTQEIITDSLQLSGEQANNFELFARGANSSGAEYLMTTNAIAKELETITGESGLFKEITADVADLSADLQIQYSRIPGTLEVATIKSKKLGLSIEKLAATGKNLLNIESSIGQELEYQLLSGRRLIDQQGKSLTNEYRVATIQGNSSKQADLMNKILEQEGETLKNNLFARQQMSELLGMDEAALSRALQKKSILEELPGGDALFEETGQQLFDAAKAMGATEEQLKELAESQDTRSTETILQSIERKLITDGIRVNIPDQAGAITQLSTEIIGASENLAQISKLGGPTMATFVGGLEMAVKVGLVLKGVAEDLGKAFAEGGWKGVMAEGAKKGSAIIAGDSIKEVGGVIEEKAMGGPVAASTPYVVGEVGPELFVPNTAGNIIPNDKISISPAAAAGTEPTLAGSAGTDPTALANAIVAAFQSGVKLEVKIDPTFTGGGMNQGRYSS